MIAPENDDVREVILDAVDASRELVKLVNAFHSDNAPVALAALALATKIVVTFAMTAPHMTDADRAKLLSDAERVALYVAENVHVVEGWSGVAFDSAADA